MGGHRADVAGGRQAEPVASATGRPGLPRPALRAAAASATRPRDAQRSRAQSSSLAPAGRQARTGRLGRLRADPRIGRLRPALRGPRARPQERRGGHGPGPAPGRRGARTQCGARTPCGPHPGAGAIRRPAACGAPPLAAVHGVPVKFRGTPRSGPLRGGPVARLGAPRAAGPAAHRGRARGRVARLRLRPSPASTRPRPPRSSRRPRTRRRPPRQPSPQRKA